MLLDAIKKNLRCRSPRREKRKQAQLQATGEVATPRLNQNGSVRRTQGGKSRGWTSTQTEAHHRPQTS